MTRSPGRGVLEAVSATLQIHTAAGLAALYTRDRRILAPNGAFTKGQQTIQAHH